MTVVCSLCVFSIAIVKRKWQKDKAMCSASAPIHPNRCLKMTIRIFHSFDSMENRCSVSKCRFSSLLKCVVPKPEPKPVEQLDENALSPMKIYLSLPLTLSVSVCQFDWLARTAYKFIIFFSRLWPRRADRNKQPQPNKQASNNENKFHRISLYFRLSIGPKSQNQNWLSA